MLCNVALCLITSTISPLDPFARLASVATLTGITMYKYLLLQVRKWATPSSGPLCIFLLNEGTYIQYTMLKVCLYGREMSTAQLDKRHWIAISQSVPNHPNQPQNGCFLILHSHHLLRAVGYSMTGWL